MSFLVSLSNFLPLPESNHPLKRPVSTQSAQPRPHSYHPTTALPSKHDFVATRRDSVPSTIGFKPSDIPTISISDSNLKAELKHSSEGLSSPIRCPPPAYIHNPPQSTNSEDTSTPQIKQIHNHPPPEYENNLYVPTGIPQRSSSCSARISSIAPIASNRRSTDRRVSFAISPAPSRGASARNSLVIVPAHSTDPTNPLHFSHLLSSSEGPYTRSTRPSLETCYSGLSSLPPLENEHQLVRSPPTMNPLLHQPLSSHPVDLDSREKWDDDAETLTDREEKKHWCCGVFWFWDREVRQLQEERRARQVMALDGVSSDPITMWIF